MTNGIVLYLGSLFFFCFGYWIEEKGYKNAFVSVLWVLTLAAWLIGVILLTIVHWWLLPLLIVVTATVASVFQRFFR